VHDNELYPERDYPGLLPYMTRDDRPVAASYELIAQHIASTIDIDRALSGSQRAQATAWRAYITAHLGDLVVRFPVPNISLVAHCSFAVIRVLRRDEELLGIDAVDSRRLPPDSAEVLCPRSTPRDADAPPRGGWTVGRCRRTGRGIKAEKNEEAR